ncbi:hypothetical protein [Okeania sp. SIO3I5]|nr:hypothetical protein [Okeania sp. SIO3I5]
MFNAQELYHQKLNNISVLVIISSLTFLHFTPEQIEMFNTVVEGK